MAAQPALSRADSSAGFQPFEDLDEADELTALSSGPIPDDYRERSICLYSDPKLRELKHYTRSHRHEGRLRATAGVSQLRPQTTSAASSSSASSSSALRYEGRGLTDVYSRQLAHSRAILPQGKLPQLGAARLRLQDRSGFEDGADRDLKREDAKSVQTRLQWRAHMDGAVKSLLQDLELARDARLEEYSHKARCDHLDKIYDWYLMHGMKEVRKERETPPHLRYIEDNPVMPGSLRIRPQQQHQPASRSASAPTLPQSGGHHGAGASALGFAGASGEGRPSSRATRASSKASSMLLPAAGAQQQPPFMPFHP